MSVDNMHDVVDTIGLAAFWEEASDDIDLRIQNALSGVDPGGNDGGAWTDVSNEIAAGNASTAIPMGTQVAVDWNDGSTDYETKWNPAAYITGELENGTTANIVVLQMHNCLPFDTEFSSPQAFLAAKTALPAGTYNCTVSAKYASKEAGTYMFTLTKNVPAGGQLVGFWNKGNATTVSSYASPQSTTPIETVNLSSGSSGTNLGTFSNEGCSVPASGIPQAVSKTINGSTVEYYGLNSQQRVSYGNNRWLHSPIRQYLNSSGSDWWQPATVFDRPPSFIGREGFLTLLDADLVRNIKPIKRVTALNYITDGGSSASPEIDVTYDKVSLISWEEHYLTPDSYIGVDAGREGSALDYWRATNPSGSNIARGNTNTNYIQYDLADGSTARYVWMRSANRDAGRNVARVNSNGGCNYGGACNAYRVAPALAIG